MQGQVCQILQQLSAAYPRLLVLWSFVNELRLSYKRETADPKCPRVLALVNYSIKPCSSLSKFIWVFQSTLAVVFCPARNSLVIFLCLANICPYHHPVICYSIYRNAGTNDTAEATWQNLGLSPITGQFAVVPYVSVESFQKCFLKCSGSSNSHAETLTLSLCLALKLVFIINTLWTHQQLKQSKVRVSCQKVNHKNTFRSHRLAVSFKIS